MSSFTQTEIDQQALDWTILRDGGISLYKSRAKMDEDAVALAGLGYRVIAIDCRTWSSIKAIHDSLSQALGFPDYYGRNLDALNECLCDDVDIPEQGGLLLQLSDFGTALARTELKETAAAILDVIARAIREHMLTGRRLILFVQIDDPNTRFEKLGCVSAIWNRREWLLTNRK